MKTYAVFAVISLLVYSRAFDNPFRQDDIALCRYVATIGIEDVFETTGFAFYRPGAMAVFKIEHVLFGARSGAYIVFNYLLHVVISLGMCLVLRRMGLGARGAWFAGGLFVLGVGHYGKEIMWACTSGGLVSVILSLAALWIMFRWLESDRRERLGNEAARFRYPLGTAIALGIAPLFHEASLWTVPVVLAAALIYGPRSWRARIRRFAPAVLVYLVWAAVFRIASNEYPAYRIGWEALIETPLRLVRYIGFMAFPAQKTAIAPLPRFIDAISGIASYAQLAVGVLGVIVLTALVFRGRLSLRMLSLWVVLWLLPFSVVRVPGSWLELRYVYCASIPYCGLLGHGFDVLGRRQGGTSRWLRRLAVAGLVCATVVLILLLERHYDRFVG